jgi:hypothetical protein
MENSNYKIIKNYWGSKIEENIAEAAIKNYLEKNEIKNAFLGLKRIVNFEVKIENNRFICLYALKKGAKRKYYVSLLNHGIALNGSTILFTNDTNFESYEKYINRELNKISISILKN